MCLCSCVQMSEHTCMHRGKTGWHLIFLNLSFSFPKQIFILLTVWVCKYVWPYAYQSMSIEFSGQFAEVSSLFPSCGLWTWNLGHRGWLHMPVPTEPLHLLSSFIFWDKHSPKLELGDLASLASGPLYLALNLKINKNSKNYCAHVHVTHVELNFLKQVLSTMRWVPMQAAVWQQVLLPAELHHQPELSRLLRQGFSVALADLELAMNTRLVSNSVCAWLFTWELGIPTQVLMVVLQKHSMAKSSPQPQKGIFNIYATT